MTDRLDEWQEPSDDLVTAVLARIGDQQHRRVFFERLDNPRWVIALERRGVFTTPPAARTDGEGREFWLPWPDGDFLARMASEVPEHVVKALSSAADSENPLVRGALLHAAIRMPVQFAVALVEPLTEFLADGTFRYSPEISDLLNHFAVGGRERETVTLASATFRPRALTDDEPRLGNRRNVFTGLDPYSYGEQLPRAIESLETVQGDAALATVTDWLDSFLEASNQLVGPDNYDVSHIWRPSISAHEQNHRFEDFGDVLVDAARDLGVKQVVEGRAITGVLETLEASQQPLLIRIGLQVLAERVADDGSVRELAAERLLRPDLLAICYRREYCKLASQALPVIERGAVNEWQELILENPSSVAGRISIHAERLQAEGESFGEALNRAQEYWQLQLLSGIRRESLPEASASLRQQLEEKHGPLEHADFPSWSSSWVGPTSPLSVEEVSQLGPDRFIDELHRWKSEISQPGQPSKDGLSRVFQDAVRSTPQPFLERVARIVDLEPIYVNAFLGGLREAVQEGREVDWSAILDICEVVTAKADNGDEDVSDEAVWRYAQRSVASLLEIGVSRDGENSLAAEKYARAVEVLVPLIDHPDPSVENEARYGGSNMDPLTLSLNTTRPAAMRAIIRVGSKARDGIEVRGKGNQLNRVVDRVLELVESRIIPERDPSLAEAAAIGEGLGRLVWMDANWVKHLERRLMSSDGFGDVVLTVALAAYQPSPILMEVLAPASFRLLERVGAGDEITIGWRNERSPVELLGDHLVMLLMWDRVQLENDLLMTFFEKAPSSSVARVLGHLGWLLDRAGGDGVPEEVLGRARDLWDWRARLVAQDEARLEELNEFFWWVGIEQLDPLWWVPKLAQAVKAPSFDPRGLIGERLEFAASQLPREVVKILERLLAGREQPIGRYDLVEHAPGILAAAMDSNDAAAIEAARNVMDRLGRGGQLRIKDLVDQRRAGHA